MCSVDGTTIYLRALFRILIRIETDDKRAVFVEIAGVVTNFHKSQHRKMCFFIEVNFRSLVLSVPD
jgi:hypothetical protein